MSALIRRRVIVSAPDTIELVEEAVPDLAPGEALVRLLCVGICGSDKAGVQGTHAFFAPPYYPGHEVVGQVVELAGGGSPHSITVGDRVVVEPTIPCGSCKPCRQARENLCERMQFFGCGYREAGMADVFCVPADRLHRIPESMTDLQAALVEPAATPFHAARIAGPLEDRAVVIIGAGTIGLLLLAIVRTRNPKRIVVVDPKPSSRRLALVLGADVALDTTGSSAEAARDALGESADVVFDCVAHESTLRDAVAMALKGGTVVVVGGAREEATIQLPQIQEYEVRIQGAITYTRADFEGALTAMGEGLVDPDELITSTYGLADAPSVLVPGAIDDMVKVLFRAD